MVLSFLKKHKKFLKSTKNSTERLKVFNIYPHSVHIRKFCTETLVKATFVHYPSVVLSDRENARRRKKEPQFQAVLAFPIPRVRLSTSKFRFFGHDIDHFPVALSTNFNDVFLCVLSLYSSGGACFIYFRVKFVLFIAIFAKIRNIPNFFNFFCALPLDTDKIKL